MKASLLSFLFLCFVCLIHTQASPRTFVSVPGEFPEVPYYSGKSTLWKTFALPYTNTSLYNPVLAASTSVPAPYQGYPDFGSDLFRVGDGTFYAITNGGPFVVCSQNPSASYAPLPLFSPTAARFSFNFSDASVDVDEMSYYWLRTSEAFAGLSTATGLSPLTQFYNESTCTFPIPSNLGYDRSAAYGLDPGAIAVLRKKQYYLIGEGYYPSLVLTDSTGLIRARYVPTNAPNSTECLTYTLPPILSFIRRTKDIGGSGGFSGIALTNYDTVAWVVLRRPLGSDAANSPTQNAQIHRVLRLDVADPLNPLVTGMFLYQTTPLSTWQQANYFASVLDIKVTALAPLGDTKFLVLERGTGNSLVYEVDFANASNVLNDPEANYLQNLILETRSNFNQSLYYNFPTKKLVLDLSQTSNINSSIAAEGLAIVTDTVIALAEDNSWDGTPFKVHTVLLGSRLPLPRRETDTHLEEPFSGPRVLLDETLAAEIEPPRRKQYVQEFVHQQEEVVTVPNYVKLNFNFGGIVSNGGRK